MQSEHIQLLQWQPSVITDSKVNTLTWYAEPSNRKRRPEIAQLTDNNRVDRRIMLLCNTLWQQLQSGAYT